jgi:hypothetical protein
MIPAGTTAALLIVVFCSDRDVRLAQETGAASALAATGVAASSASNGVDGATNVLATASARITAGVRGRINFCDIERSPRFDECVRPKRCITMQRASPLFDQEGHGSRPAPTEGGWRA